MCFSGFWWIQQQNSVAKNPPLCQSENWATEQIAVMANSDLRAVDTRKQLLLEIIELDYPVNETIVFSLNTRSHAFLQFVSQERGRIMIRC